MSNNIIRTFSFFILSVLLTSLTFLYNIESVKAVQIDSETSGNNSLNIVIEESTDKFENSKINSVPDLGDDQAFPFIPGFGKNSGKD